MELANEELSGGRYNGLDLKMDQLMFISGTVKTTGWLTAIIHGSSDERAGSVSFGINNIGKVSFRVSVANAALPRSEYNYGPLHEPSQSTEIVPALSSGHISQVPGPLNPTQCAFVHYYKMKKRMIWMRRVMRAAAGPHQLPPGDDNPGEGSASHEEGSSGEDSDIEEHPPRSKCYDPVDILLDWILEHSHAEVAIAADRDLISIFAENGIPDDIRAGLEAVTPSIDVDEEGVGTIVVTVNIGITVRSVAEGVSQNTERLEGEEPSTGRLHDLRGDPETASAAHHTQSERITGSSQSEHQEDNAERLTEEELRRRRLMEQPLAGEPAANGHGSSVTSLAVSPDSERVASGSDNSTIILWDTGDKSVVRKWESHGDVVWDLAFSPDSQRLASAGGDGRIMIWNVEHGEHLGTLEGHTNAVHSIVWSPDGTKLASASDDMTARVWDMTTYQQLFVLNGHDAMVMFVVFSPDGTMLASGGADYTCRIWNPEDGKLRHDLQGHKGIVWMAAFDPDSRRIATSSDDGGVRVWNITTGEELLAIHEHYGPVWSVSFSPDGRQILSASSDSSIYICDSFTGERRVSMDGHDSMVNSACFSSDGKYVASSSSDHTVRLWKAEDGSCIRTFNEHDDKVLHVLFTPDAQMLTSGAHDGTVLLRVMSDWI
ncbi:WD40-repeat-containing domain protein [Daedaleopsis nitida]|nr:WD40-repeat-containing domain protein [Daedaleopsis nitida]